ncbi:MAG: hypothetical protein KDB61_15335, partial [Planctomycetes bacterium]|nr:hypothetical protein [Planctomycetota bacterium]
MTGDDALLEILDGAMQCPPGERQAFVRQRCAGDDELCARVWKLLQEEQSGSQNDWDLEAPRRLIAPVLDVPSHPLLGERVGSWEVHSVLGEG